MAKRRRILKAILPLLVVLFFVIAAVAAYIASVNSSVRDQSIADILEVTDQGRHAFDTYISREKDFIHHFALHYSQMDSSNAEELQHNLSSIKELGSDYFVIDLEHGTLYSNHYEPQTLNKADLDKFNSSQGYVINEPGDSSYTGVRGLSCYETFRFADGRKGIVQSEQAISAIVEEFSLLFFDGEGYADIVNRDGKILVRSDSKKNNRTFENLFDIIDRNGNNEEDIQTFKAALANKKSGAVRFNNQEEAYVYTFVPLKSVETWYMVSIIPDSVITEHTRGVLISQQMIWIPTALCLVFLAVLIYEIYNQRKRFRKKDIESEFWTKFLSGLAEDTRTVFFMLDPEDYTVEYVSSNVERVLGVHEKNVRANIQALDVDGFEDENIINFDIFRDVKPGEPISFEKTKTHAISGEVMQLSETVYRITRNDTEWLLVAISDRPRKRRTGARI